MFKSFVIICLWNYELYRAKNHAACGACRKDAMYDHNITKILLLVPLKRINSKYTLLMTRLCAQDLNPLPEPRSSSIYFFYNQNSNSVLQRRKHISDYYPHHPKEEILSRRSIFSTASRGIVALDRNLPGNLCGILRRCLWCSCG